MKGKILVFGGNSFLAKTFNEKYKDIFTIQNVYRNNPAAALNFDFEKDEVETIVDKLGSDYVAILFFQGIKPSVAATAITTDHFTRMLKINLVTPALLVQKLAGRLSEGAMVLFVSSVAKKKGSFDPAYGSAKAGLTGLMHSLANAYPQQRFNIVSLGLVENSPVFNGMTDDFKKKHSDRMFNNKFVKAEDVIGIIGELISNKSINRADIEIDGGYS